MMQGKVNDNSLYFWVICPFTNAQILKCIIMKLLTVLNYFLSKKQNKKHILLKTTIVLNLHLQIIFVILVHLKYELH